MKTKIFIGSLSLIGVLISCSEDSQNKIETPEIAVTHSSQAENHPMEYPLDDEDQILAASNDVAPPEKSENKSPTGWLEESIIDPNIEVMPIYLPEEIIDFETVFRSMEEPLQIQSINNRRDTVITFKQGTVLLIKANSFETESGEDLQNSTVELSVGEYYDLGDLLSNNLNTQTENALLETGGTIYIEAKSGGQKCKLKEGANVDIEFPTSNKLDNMQIFEGDWVEDRIVWEADYDAPTGIINFDSDVEAQFPGGNQDLWMYIQREVYYPREAHDNNEQGRVFVSFNVKVNGAIDSVRIEKGVSKTLDKEAMRVIRKMPRWTPAEINGNKYKSRVRLPIQFILDGGQDPRSNRSKSTNNESYRKSIEDKITKNQGSNPNEISNYLLSSSALGWINCDRFYQDDREKIDVTIESLYAEKENVKIVFDKQKSVMQGMVSENSIKFSKLPYHEPITIVAVKVKNNQLYFAVKKTYVDYYGIGPLEYKKCTLDELQVAMAKLDWK